MSSEFIIVYLFVYLFIGVIGVLSGLILQFNTEKRIKSSSAKSDLENLTVLIPFRNECDPLPRLIRSFRESSKLPKKIIFVNDHSDDGSSQILKETVGELPVSVIDLPVGITGKKEAIRFGLQQVQTEYVLSMDADIRFRNDYFEILEEIKWSDLNVLPVFMTSSRGFKLLFQLDHLLVNALNTSSSGWKRPFIASGANLLYSRTAFQKYDRYDLHKHMPSGDDTYLLRDFRNAGANIQLHSESGLAVETDVPKTVGSFLSQRVRWAAKTGDLNDPLANMIVFVQGLLTIGFVTLSVLLLTHQEFIVFLFFWGSKTFLDVAIFHPFFYRSKRLKQLFWMPVFELFYPFFALAVLIASLVMKPTWKGRAIRVR